MPAEESLRITRSCLEVIAQYRFPLHLITRSPLVLRDIDLLQRIDNEAILPDDLRDKMNHGVVVASSFTTVDESIAKKFEPGSPSPKDRLTFLNTLHRSGLFVGMNCMPLLPGITDTQESLVSIAESAKVYEIDYLLAGSLTLFGHEPADSRMIMLKMVEQSYPYLYKRYVTTFRGNDTVSQSYQRSLNRRMRAVCAEKGIKFGLL